MAVGFSNTNKPINPRGADASPKGYNRAALYSGKALDFDGVNDKVDVPLTINGSFSLVTISSRTGSPSNSSAIVSTQQALENGISFGFASTGEAQIRVNDEVLTGVNVINESLNHIAATWDGSTIKLIVNGIEEASASYSGSLTSTQEITMWNFPHVSAYRDGQSAGLKYFNTALTAAQVADLYNNPEKVVPTGVDNTALKLWLPMQEGAGTTAYDGSGNGNHGTISGATWTHGIGAPVAQTAVIDWNKGTNIVQNTDVSASYWSAGSQVTRTGDQESVSGLYNSATLIEDTTTNASHWAGAAVSTSASTTYVQAAFVKKKDSGIYASLRTNGAGSNSFIVFDFDSATIVGVGSDIIDSGVIAFSNGWYRIWMKYTLAPSGIIIGVSNSTSAPIPAYAGTGIGFYADFPTLEAADEIGPALTTNGTAQTSPVLLPQGLTSGRDITGVNLFENVRKQGALNLDGNSWAEVHDNASVDVVTGITLECWVYFEGISQSGLLAKWGSTTGVDRCYMLMTGADGKVRFYTNTDAGIDTTALSIGWNHIVGTYDKTTPIRKLYINAVEKDSDAYSTDLVVSDKPVEIGRYNYSTQYQHPGQIAQPRIYNRALTASEVLQNYNSGKNIYK